MINIAINGFGRIGRTFFKLASQNPKLKIVAVNDIAQGDVLAHLLKYDSIQTTSEKNVFFDAGNLNYGDLCVPLFHNPQVGDNPWELLNVDVVVDCTGRYLTKESLQSHITAGAKRVILSAPPNDDIKSVVIGVNHSIINSTDLLISNASCTTNNAAPMIKVLDDLYGVKSAYITTVHSYTSDQRLVDSPHKDFRRARAAAVSIIPTTTGAAKAISKIFPHLSGKLGGSGIRVPVSNGSLTDITCIVERDANVSDINNSFLNASQNELKGILEYTNEPIVSVDVIGNTSSCIFDSQLTSVIGNMVKIVGWYDNEMGYSSRLVDLILLINK
jgi:glyceraldehyde 3-phosphate dehydrogenase